MATPDVRFLDDGLVPVVVQDAASRQVLMLGYMNAEALRATVDTGLVHFWSRSRQRLWRKGETSGNTLEVVGLSPDCDGDALLAEVHPAGPTCHTGTVSCFDVFEGATAPVAAGFGSLESLWRTIEARGRERPSGSYTASLVAAGVDEVGRKVVEEATEVLIAAKNHASGRGGRERVAEEGADLLYHLLVLLAERGIGASEVLDVLAERARQS